MTDRTRHILVVDDDPAIHEFLSLFLSAEGFVVRGATSLDAAERELAVARPDVVICDVRMPGLPPFAMLDRLRADPATQELPVLVCTGAVHDLEQAGEQALRGQTLVLPKPFEISELLVCLDRLCPPQCTPMVASDDASDGSRQ